MFGPSGWFLVVFSSFVAVDPVAARIRCMSYFDCELATNHDTSECIDGYCTNPYYRGGCMASTDPQNNGHFLRTCNSEDLPDAAQKGYCRPSAMNYPEGRSYTEILGISQSINE